MALALYLLVLAVLLGLLNIYTTRSRVAKRISYLGMWAAIGASVVLAVAAAL